MKIRSLPVEKEAHRFVGPFSVIDMPVDFQRVLVREPSVAKIPYYSIKTPEGRMRVNPGDWIIKGVVGEFYPCKPDVFEKTYELVVEPKPEVSP